MSILDTFFILFESDTKGLDKGLSESDKKSKGLQSTLKETDAVAGKLGNSLAGAIAGLAGVALAALSFTQLTQAVMAATNEADHLNETAERLQVNIETLSAWGDLTKKSGGSVDAFASSIEGLNRNLAQIDVTGKSRAAPFLKELGIDLDDVSNKGKTAMDFLPQLADVFEKLGVSKSIALGSRLGLDQATIMTLAQGRRAVDELLMKEKELGVVTAEQGRIADKFNDTLDDTRHAFRSVWLGISEYVIPPLTWMAEKFQSVALFMRKHSDFIVGALIAVGAAIAYFVVPPLISMAAAAFVVIAPFLGIAAAVTAAAFAFALIYDDVMNFIDGNDSLIGQILKEYPEIMEVINGVIDAFKSLYDVGVMVANFFVDMWNKPGEMFDAFLAKIIGGLKAIPGIAATLFSTANLTGVAQAQLGAASGTALGSQTSNSINNARSKSTSVSIGEVKVQTQATDAAGISKAIGNSIETQMRQAVANYDDGVLG